MLYEEAVTSGALLKKVFLKISQNKPGICQGNGGFLELGHLDKHSSINTRQTGHAGKNFGSFLLKKL